jgi:hypothetical protein
LALGAVPCAASQTRALDPARRAVLLGKARVYEIERHPYEARAEHEPTRPDYIKVERTLQHPQRRDVGWMPSAMARR